MRLPLLLVLVFVLVLAPVRAAEPFFKKGDVIALVGGEDMVVASEYGYLELLLVRALPDYRLRFRNLAWEGDTVFEQRRDLNFPTWEEQLDKIGATVVIAQFGQMESLAGKEKLPEFIAAYEKLIERFSAGGKRRVLILAPGTEVLLFLDTAQRHPSTARSEAINEWNAALPALAARAKAYFPAKAYDLSYWANMLGLNNDYANPEDAKKAEQQRRRQMTRDGIHLTSEGHKLTTRLLVPSLAAQDSAWTITGGGIDHPSSLVPRPLLSLIIAKNRLWFDYWRPQNWAFLAGDRTAQPSSRDHLDPSKRWFPPEREAFLPLIEAKEKEIDALAQKLAQP